MEANQKRPFQSRAVFEFLGYKLNQIKKISEADLNLISTGSPLLSILKHPNGTLVKLKTDPKVYLIENNQLHWIPTLEIFRAKGYSFERVITISEAELNSYERGEEER